MIAQTFVALPFLVLAVEGALQGVDARLELAAAGLGASRFTVFRRVTLPLDRCRASRPARCSASPARSASSARRSPSPGSFPGVTQTIPISAYIALQTDPDAAIVLSLLLLAISVVVLIALRERWVRGVLR